MTREQAVELWRTIGSARMRVHQVGRFPQEYIEEVLDLNAEDVVDGLIAMGLLRLDNVEWKHTTINDRMQRPAPGQMWQHVKTGHYVQIEHLAKMQDADQQRDMKEVVVYRHGGSVWTRLLTEFMDGRFVRVK